MKKQFFRAGVVRRVINRFLVTAVIAVTGFTVHAQTSQVKQESVSPATSVKYMGSRQDILSVAVQYSNAKGQPFTITVHDQDGYQFFQGHFTEKKFSKVFELPKTDVSKLIFIIRNARTNEVQSFEVNTKAVEETVVKRIG